MCLTWHNWLDDKPNYTTTVQILMRLADARISALWKYTDRHRRTIRPCATFGFLAGPQIRGFTLLDWWKVWAETGTSKPATTPLLSPTMASFCRRSRPYVSTQSPSTPPAVMQVIGSTRKTDCFPTKVISSLLPPECLGQPRGLTASSRHSIN